jgi:hypothetical protein
MVNLWYFNTENWDTGFQYDEDQAVSCAAGWAYGGRFCLNMPNVKNMFVKCCLVILV